MGLPMIFGLLVSSTVAGALITKFGRWKAYLAAGSVVMTAGMLLLSTIGADTGVPVISAFMAVLGIGVGLLMQSLVLAAQNDVPAAELGATTSALTFFRSIRREPVDFGRPALLGRVKVVRTGAGPPTSAVPVARRTPAGRPARTPRAAGRPWHWDG
jgi:hypothetical protein